MAKCLVLGANGFIGSHLVDSLIARGHTIRAFDRYNYEMVTRFDANNAIELFNGDFLNRSDLQKALEGVDYVFHFISTTTPITADADPLIDIETNVRMTIELLQDSVSQGTIKKVVFASTGGAVYGLNSGESVSESVTPLPISPYAIGKLTIEHYLRYFEKKFGLPSVVFRISNPYGERQALKNKQGVIPIFLQHIANHEPITILGDGSMVRDYIYVEDVADMIAASFEQTNENLYNLGAGQGVSVNELIEIIKQVVHKDITTSHSPNLATFVDKIVLDTSRFTNEFSVRPTTDLKSGIAKTWSYITSQS